MEQLPLDLQADSAMAPPASEEKPVDPGVLLERHKKYADDFATWLKGLNRHDFMQAKKVLEAMTRAYFKHTVKIHSPPAKDNSDVSSKTSDGAPRPDLSNKPADH